MASTRNLTPLELRIMQVLWSRGPSTVAEVQAALPEEPAYTTVQTMLAILLRKGKAAREAEGRAYRYRATVSEAGAADSVLRDLVRRMFGGDPEALLLTLVDSRQVTPETLRRLGETLADEDSGERKKKKKKRKAERHKGDD